MKETLRVLSEEEVRPIYVGQIRSVSKRLTCYEETFKDLVYNYPDLIHPHQMMRTLHRIKIMRGRDMRRAVK